MESLDSPIEAIEFPLVDRGIQMRDGDLTAPERLEFDLAGQAAFPGY
jgi:hypothetical protein